MKLNKWLFGAAAALMLGACSDNLDGPKAPSQPAEEGQGYIGINIQLPTTSGTRANDDFEDGVLAEYEVNDAVIVLFQGDDATSATCSGAFFLQEAEPSMDNSSQVTRHSIRVANVTGVGMDKNLYALVLANGMNRLYSNNVAQAAWMEGATIKDFQEKIMTLDEATGGVGSTPLAFFTQPTAGRGTASNIFMTNSPLSEKAGGAVTPGNLERLPVLVELSPKVYPTQSDAIANPAGIIHIERIVAKVTCSNFPSETGIVVTVNGFPYRLDVDKVSWDMAQDQKQTFLVRNTNRTKAGKDFNSDRMWSWRLNTSLTMPKPSLGKYRMIGGEQIASKKLGTTVNEDGERMMEDQAYYRPYFCQVPGYDETDESGNDPIYEKKTFNKTVMEFEDAVAWSSLNHTGAFYPLENTFPVRFMKYANTTRIGFWVTFKFTALPNDEGVTGPAISGNDVDFYINGMDKTTLYLKENGHDPLTNRVLSELSTTIKGEDDKDIDETVNIDGTEITFKKMKYDAMWNAVLTAINMDEVEEGFVNDVDLFDLIDIEYGDNANNSITIKSIKFKERSVLNAIPKYSRAFRTEINYTFNDDLITELNNLGSFTRYDSSRAFYEVRIKHFGDDLTPWDGETKASATTIEESYGDGVPGVSDADQEARDNNYLGRYGVVRNNWYDIAVNSIARLGDPQDPAKWDANWKNKPDDNKDQYIAIELRVLSWARRFQDVDF